MEEQAVQQPGGKGNKKVWIGILTVLLLIASAGIFIFGINQFYLTIELTGEQDVVLEYGEPWEDPGAAVVIRGTILAKEGFTPADAAVNVTGEVCTDALGEYQLHYSAECYWMTASQDRSIQVVDTQCPEIKLVADPYLKLIEGKPYKEEGYTATDNHDGDITEKVDRQELYGKVIYTVTDTSGNSTTVEREIPYYDPLPPTILLEGEKTILHQVGRPYEEPGFLALDNVDGELTDQVVIEGEVDIYKPNIYPIQYKVADKHGNWGFEVRTVEVVKEPRPEVVTPKGKVIYLTFDDGPGPFTDELLYLLDVYGIKATFFVTNSGYNDMMRKIVADGHSIGIHTIDHAYETIYSSPENFFADLYGMQKIIYDETGVLTTLMRFPGGGSNLVSRPLYPGLMTLLTRAVQDAGFQYFDWNVDSNDAGGAVSQEVIAGNVIGGVMNQRVSIVLQHDIYGASVNAVEDIILWGLENGYTFLPLQQNSPTFHHPVYN